MASSGMTASVSLKDRIAALQQRNATPGATSAPTVPSSTSGGLTPSASAGSVTGSLRDKISKFELKGGTPVPRGSFGMGAPPPEDLGASKRKGELYGNRVPGLSRPHHNPRSASGLQPQRRGSENEIAGRRTASDSGRPGSPALTELGDGSAYGGSRAGSPAFGEHSSTPGTPSLHPTSPLSRPAETPSILVSPDPVLQPVEPLSLDVRTEDIEPAPASPPAPPSPAEVALAGVLNGTKSPPPTPPAVDTPPPRIEEAASPDAVSAPVIAADDATEVEEVGQPKPVLQVEPPSPTEAPVQEDVQSAIASPGAAPAERPTIVTSLSTAPDSIGVDTESSLSRDSTETVRAEPTISITVTSEPPSADTPLEEAFSPALTSPPATGTSYYFRAGEHTPAEASTPISPPTSPLSSPLSVGSGSQYSSSTAGPASPASLASSRAPAPSGLSSLISAAFPPSPVSPLPSTPSTAHSVTAHILALSSAPPTPGTDDGFDNSHGSNGSADAEIVQGEQVHISPTSSHRVFVPPSPITAPPLPAVLADLPAPPPPPARAETAPEAVSVSPLEEASSGGSTPPAPERSFSAVVHRRTTIRQAKARPATSYYDEPSSPAPTLPRVPARTVTDADLTFTGEDLSALLANAALLEAQLAYGRSGTPRKETFPVPALPRATPNAPTSWHAKAATEPALVDERSYGAHAREASHGRTESEATVKALSVRAPRDDKTPTASPPRAAALPTFSDFEVQELALPPGPAPRSSSETIPPTPPPKEGARYLAGLRALKPGGTLKRMSMLLHDDASARHSVSSSEDSTLVMTPPSPEFDQASLAAPPRRAPSSTHLRDDAASHLSGESSWSLKGSTRKKGGLSRAATFADKIWGGSRRSRAPSTSSIAAEDMPPPRVPSPAPSIKPLALGADDLSAQLTPLSVPGTPDPRHMSWMSTSSSNISSPGIDYRLVDQFPSVPAGPAPPLVHGASAGAPPLAPLQTTALPTPKYDEHGMLLTPPDRSSSLVRTFTTTSVRSKRRF